MVGKSGEPEPEFNLNDYGRGTFHEETGLWDYYDVPPEAQARLDKEVTGGGWTWHDIWAHHDLIEADLQDAGVDLSSGIMRRRTARWLRVRILGLLATDSRLLRALTKNQQNRQGS